MDVFAGILVFLGLLGLGTAVIMLLIKVVFKKGWEYKRTGTVAVVALVLFVSGMVMAGPSVEQDFEIGRQAAKDEPVAPVSAPKQNIEKTVNSEKKVDKKLDFKAECEKNAAEHPAKMGSILYTKGDYDFTGMKYYFKGEIVKLDTIENIGDPSVWLVKNEHGYVMPIQHYHFEAKIGDSVEVWGTLTGNGYANVEGIDNVVGQTGSVHALQVTVNGEVQY